MKTNLTKPFFVFLILSMTFSMNSFGDFKQDSLKYENDIKSSISPVREPAKVFRLIRNEIYAKHGRAFQSKDLQDYFSAMKWYRINKDYKDALLSSSEKSFIDKLVKLEKEYSNKHDVPIWSDTGKSSANFYLTNGYGLAVINEQKYLHTSVWECKGQRNWVIVSQKIQLNYDDMAEGLNPTLKATCFLFDSEKHVKKSWSISVSADEGKLGKFYEAIQFGCCTSQDNSKFYSIKKGNLVLECTSELLEVEPPNSCMSMHRFIGYKSAETFSTFQYEQDSLYVGTITYASKDSMISKIIIKAISDSAYEKHFGLGYGDISFTSVKLPNKINGKNHLDLWKADKSQNSIDLTDFSVKVVFFDNDSIIVPIRNDSLQITNTEGTFFKFQRIK